MDLMEMYLTAKAAKDAGAKRKVFDWAKAARIIAERQPDAVDAGLKEDWFGTAAVIYAAGEIVRDSPYLVSLWATPVLVLAFVDDDPVEIECWIMEDDVPAEWNPDGLPLSRVIWPEAALYTAGGGCAPGRRILDGPAI